MTIGIYALYWEEQDLIYIGQSQDISARYKEHLYKMRKNTHTNYKVQNTYNSYGYPSLIILEKCALNIINDKEIFWTKEFDSINNGLNIIEAGSVGFGYNSNASKYSKIQILKVFHSLYVYKTLSLVQIAKYCEVSTSLVQDLSKGKIHLWLKEKYPKHWSKIQQNRSLRRSYSSSRVYIKAILISPEGKEYEVDNISIFSKKYNLLERRVADIIRKDRKSHKGWVLKQ